jgi:hypothetical protein
VKSPCPSPSSPPIEVLVIGDSISCGYIGDSLSGAASCSCGYLDAFPSVTQRLLNAPGTALPAFCITSVAYPGITLANPPGEDDSACAPRGMAERFFQVSDEYNFDDFGPYHEIGESQVFTLGRIALVL